MKSLKGLSINNCYIFGEDHTTEYRKIINDKILSIHNKEPFQYLILEEIGSNSFFTKAEKEQGILDHMYNVGSMGLQLAIDLNIPAIGMDLWDDYVYEKDIADDEGYAIDFTNSFKLREAKMLKTIIEYRKKGNIAVIVGDSHLRTVSTEQLGSVSPLHIELSSTSTIIRCPNKEIE